MPESFFSNLLKAQFGAGADLELRGFLLADGHAASEVLRVSCLGLGSFQIVAIRSEDALPGRAVGHAVSGARHCPTALFDIWIYGKHSGMWVS